jgi:peptidoglycan hydrolase-like protein with peptidoglycan-binding domain
MKRWQLLAGAAVLGLATMGAQAHAIPLMDASPASASDGRLVQVALSTTMMSYSPRNVQILLGELGYAVGAPDGVIGPRSRAAIQAFQTDSGLPASGEPSLALFQKLEEAVDKQQGQSSAQASPPAQPVPSPDLVGGIQGELRQRGYLVPETGQLDGPTIAGIRAYQSSAGLPVTGEPSQALLTNLQAAPRSAAAVSQLQRQQVLVLQHALNERGFDAGPEDGAIGPKVRGAIRGYQASHGMPVTGEVSQELLAQLGVIPGGPAASTGTDTASQEGTPPGFGMSSDQVSELEQSLTALGYKPGRVDGVYDRKTRDAIMEYQDDNHLTKDGLATPDLLSHVRTNLAARTGTTYTVGRGELAPSDIAAVQNALGRQGYYHGTASGVYDDETANAVRKYQRDAGLPVTGTLDANLIARLQSQTASPALVMAIEQELSRRGFRTGPVDGQNDPQTQAAIGDFLRQAHLSMPDVPSEQLLAAIRSSRVTAQNDFLGNLFGSQ